MTHVSLSVPGHRGRVLAAGGEVLAEDDVTWRVFIDPVVAAGRARPSARDRELRLIQRIETMHSAFPHLRPADPEAMILRIVDALDHDRHSFSIGTLRTPEERIAFENWLAPRPERRAYSIEPRVRRRYPMEELVGPIVGGFGSDYEYWGVEGRVLDELRAFDGVVRYRRDARNRGAWIEYDGNVDPRHGDDVALTIDLECQRVLLEAIDDVRERSDPRLVTGLILDPSNGAILAAASWPTAADVRAMTGVEKLEQKEHLQWAAPHFLGLLYEPGSTIKPLVVAEALVRGVSPRTILKGAPGDSKVFVQGRGRRTIRDVHEDGPLDLEGAIIHSSNIAMAALGLSIGRPGLEACIERFSLTEKTGVEMANEQAGYGPHTSSPSRQRRWSWNSTISVAIGYEIMVTPLQLARAYCVLANGGYAVNPHFVARPDTPRDESRRALSAPIAAIVRTYMREAIEAAEVKDPRLVNWGSERIRLAGKTGTAAMLETDPETGKRVYSKRFYRSSFIGFAPVDNPRYVMMIVAEKPKGAYYGSQVARPSVIRALAKLLPDLALGEDRPTEEGVR